MPDEITTSESAPITEVTADKKSPKFTLEKIDNDNVKKMDTREEVSVVNIPALRVQKAELEKTIGNAQTQLNQIDEVLAEYEKLPK